GLAGVVHQETGHPCPEERVAEQAPQLMRDLGALRVHMPAEKEGDRVVPPIIAPNERADFVLVRLHRLLLLAPPVELRSVPAAGLLLLYRLHVRRDPLVAPDVGPIGSR